MGLPIFSGVVWVLVLFCGWFFILLISPGKEGRKLALGIDVGTSGCKVVAFTEGEILASWLRRVSL